MLRRKSPRVRKRTSNRRPLKLESLENRQMLAGDLDITPNAQLLIELINRARENPAAEATRYGIGLNDDVPAASTISNASKQPLAPHQALVDAAVAHSLDMLDRDFFAHNTPAPNSTSPSDRARAAGYPADAGENIGWGGSTGAIDQVDHVYARHESLFKSVGHRINMLYPNYRELGAAVEYGVFTAYNSELQRYLDYNASMATEMFGSRGGDQFITGVAYDDSIDENNFYNIGEAEAGLIVQAENSLGTIYETTTADAGGYSLQVPAGTYTVTFTGGGYTGQVVYENVEVDGQNVKVDLDTSDASWTQPADLERVEIADIGRGVAVLDNATGVGYMMYSLQDVRTRFTNSPPVSVNSPNFIAVRLEGSQWQYNNNTTWVNFSPATTDRLMASIDFSSDTINSFEGTTGTVAGVRQGYQNGDLVFLADRFDGSFNEGEFQVVGSYFEHVATTTTERVDIPTIGRGVAVLDTATGTGYLMYSGQDVRQRFTNSPPVSINSENFVAVRLNGEQWQFNNNTDWINFSPVSSDRLMASIDFDNDTILSLAGSTGALAGIEQGFSDGDLVFWADRFDGSSNEGEFQVTGSYFEFIVEPGERIDIPVIGDGVAVLDVATGSGYLMYSAEDVRQRFSNRPPVSINSANFIAVRLDNGQWQYNDNSNWNNFTPLPTDRLMASVDFDNDTATSLRGASGAIAGLQQGFSGGDLAFYADRFNGSANEGEFQVTGSYFEYVVAPGNRVDIADPGLGIAALDVATGTGYLMYSQQDVRQRFSSSPPVAVNSANFIAVRLNGDQWQFNNNTNWIDFTPVGTDRLLASVDFDNDTVVSLLGATGSIGDIQQGFASGDLVFYADRFDGRANEGEFQVEGSYFEVAV